VTSPRERLRAFRFVHGAEELAVLSIPSRPSALPPELTKAEREVCRMIELGCSNAQIAAARGTAPRTVANQVASIFQKLGVASRAELLARLIEDQRQP
jgi:DNA-binding CsgD family transcriptional regulator